MAVFEDAEGNKIKTTHFGQRGASDYTKHGDKERMERYLERHGGGFETSTKEDWKDPTTAGSLSRWILWNKPSLSASFADYKKRFGLKGSLSVSKSAEGLEVNNEQKFVLKNPQDYEAMMEEIRPQLEAHKFAWKLWYLEKRLGGVGGKTWKRDGVYPVVIIRPNEMEWKMSNTFIQYLRKQKGGVYGNPYKHLVFKGNHIYGGDEERGFEGMGVKWFDPKIDRPRIETLWFKETKKTKIKTKNGVEEITGNEWSVWRGRPTTPKKKDMRPPPQFKKMMEDVGFTDFKPKMEMGSELYIHPTWRANKVPIGALVKIPHEWGGKYYARVVESRPANKAETKSFIRKNKDKGDSEKAIERAENGELWSLSFNISEWPQEVKNKFKDYIVDEDYFIGLNFPETSLQPSKVLYSKEADKYYAAGMESPYQDNTSFMLSLLGIDFKSETFEAKSPAQKSLDKWTKEDWGTKSGKPSTQGSQATGERYLPAKAREALTDEEYARTSAKKRRDTAKGKQFSQQPDDIEEKTAKYRSEVFEAIEGTGSKARFTDQPDPKIYRDPALRQKARNKLLKGNKGGDEGEWSARKAQMAATEYRKMYENKYGVGKNPYF